MTATAIMATAAVMTMLGLAAAYLWTQSSYGAGPEGDFARGLYHVAAGLVIATFSMIIGTHRLVDSHAFGFGAALLIICAVVAAVFSMYHVVRHQPLYAIAHFLLLPLCGGLGMTMGAYSPAGDHGGATAWLYAARILSVASLAPALLFVGGGIAIAITHCRRRSARRDR